MLAIISDFLLFLVVVLVPNSHWICWIHFDFPFVVHWDWWGVVTAGRIRRNLLRRTVTYGHICWQIDRQADSRGDEWRWWNPPVAADCFPVIFQLIMRQRQLLNKTRRDYLAPVEAASLSCSYTPYTHRHTDTQTHRHTQRLAHSEKTRVAGWVAAWVAGC